MTGIMLLKGAKLMCVIILQFTFQILMMARAARMSKELSMLEVSPPPGAQCWKVLIRMCFVAVTESSG